MWGSRTTALLAAAALGAAALGACGSGAAAGTTSASVPPTVTLTMTVDDGRGHRRVARLTCRGSVGTATGYLRPRAQAACTAARALAGFLAARPPAGRICTQVYGGPDTARVAGTIGARHVDRRFSRRDGCEIGDWRRAGPLLPAPTGTLGRSTRP
jgi:hypothetical protein